MNIDSVYKNMLIKVEKTLGSGSTYNTELLQYGKDVFGKKFHGVYAADNLPKLTKNKPYAIINLDNIGETGSHWIALAKSGEKIIFYDSFGRPNKSILPLLTKEAQKAHELVIDTEEDAEQNVIEENCGSRAMTFLIMFDKFGEKIALQI